MSASFNKAVKFTLSWEGGLSEHSNDPGGLTKFGISSRQYPTVDIRTLTLADAEDIYRSDYWDTIQGSALPDAVAFVLFDYAVNAGVDRASRSLQNLVGAEVDGRIGPFTLNSVRPFERKYLTFGILDLRARHYIQLLRSSDRYVPFTFGWERRLIACAIEAGALL